MNIKQTIANLQKEQEKMDEDRGWPKHPGKGDAPVGLPVTPLLSSPSKKGKFTQSKFR